MLGLLCFLAVLTATASADLMPTLTYRAIAWEGIYGPCPAVVSKPHRNPTPEELAGLTVDYFYQLYLGLGWIPNWITPQQLHIDVFDSNEDGVVIGQVYPRISHHIPFIPSGGITVLLHKRTNTLTSSPG